MDFKISRSVKLFYFDTNNCYITIVIFFRNIVYILFMDLHQYLQSAYLRLDVQSTNLGHLIPLFIFQNKFRIYISASNLNCQH